MDVGELVRDVLHNLELTYGERFRLTVESEPVRGHLDPDAIRRALENLLTNAVKYGASHRPITVRVSELFERLQLAVHNEGTQRGAGRARLGAGAGARPGGE